MITVTLPLRMDRLKMLAIVAALEETEHNVVAAARLLGCGRRTIHRYLRAWRIAADVKRGSGVQPPTQPVQVPVFGSGRLTQAPEWEYTAPTRAWVDEP